MIAGMSHNTKVMQTPGVKVKHVLTTFHSALHKVGACPANLCLSVFSEHVHMCLH
jgi:hypothetical protein